MACVAIGCKSRMGVLTESDQRISFHRFPKEPDLRNKWKQNVNRESWTPSPYSRLCSLHFHKSCYRKGFQTKVLHSDAVPTIFTHVPTSLQKGKFKRPRSTRLELCTPSTSMKSHEDELSELKGTISKKNKIIEKLKKVVNRLKTTAERRGRVLKKVRQQYHRQNKIIAHTDMIINELRTNCELMVNC
ncbi:THAP domain-containing protein 1 B-like [Choristoneura fumiferana]|uniref:THAP domain-containing protein 1 B-like n=1 Tax=Choristoneura fumiferana TaxID=7141 RepID=UPI003D15A478